MSTPDLEAAAKAAVDAAVAAGAGDAEAWVEESVSRQIRVYEGAVESLTDAGSRGIGLRVFIDGRSGYAYGTDLGEKGCQGAGGGGEGDRGRGRSRRVRRPAGGVRRDPHGGPALGGARRLDHRAQDRARGGDRARGALAPGCLAGRGHGLRGLRGQRGARQLARLLLLLRGHHRLGLCVRLRGRGRRPHDRPRPRPRARAGRARPAGDRRRGRAARARARRRSAAGQPPLSGGVRRVRGRELHRLHRRDAVRRRRAARPLAVRRQGGRGDRLGRAASGRRRHGPRRPRQLAVRRRGLPAQAQQPDRGREARSPSCSTRAPRARADAPPRGAPAAAHTARRRASAPPTCCSSRATPTSRSWCGGRATAST